MSIRRIVLMRHAKSSWKSDAKSDHERPLNKRGRKAAPKVAAELARLGWIPDQVLSSDSARTTETWARMKDALGDVPVDFHHDLYLAGIDEIREVVAPLDEGVETVLLLGHNPGWEEALGWLSGEDEVMKTGVAALLTRDAESWASAIEKAGGWTLQALILPREL